MEPVFLEVTAMNGKPLLILLQSIVKIIPTEEPHRSLCTALVAWHGHIESIQIRESLNRMKERMLAWSTFLEMDK